MLERVFALPAARIVGTSGAVYRVDPNAESLEELRDKAEQEGLTNIFLFAGNAEDVLPCQGCADIVFFGNSLHDLYEPGQALANAKRILKSDGILADLDWKKKPTSGGGLRRTYVLMSKMRWH